MKRVRTIEQAHEELLKEDPGCGLTKSGLRRLVVTGAIPAARVGAKYLVSLESIERYLEAAAG